ncbi:MAG: lysine transporter LysE [Hyphomicrobiaceae bacterium]|nr:MAG: lysine transporter LysE [Hyphomicrobiaceae bacterium]
MTFIPNPLIIPVGMVVGVLLAMPFGPVNLLGIQRAVERGFFGGMAAGLGIMLGDGLIALGAALGVNAMSGAIREYRTAIQIVGGLALLGAGIKLYLTEPTVVTETHAAKATLRDYIWDIPQTFLLTITNPGALLGLVAIFGGVSSFVEVESYVDALTMVAAIMGGSFCYWFIVSQRISQYRHRFDTVQLGKINRIAGLILIGFGGVLIGEMVIKRLRLW